MNDRVVMAHGSIVSRTIAQAGGFRLDDVAMVLPWPLMSALGFAPVHGGPVEGPVANKAAGERHIRPRERLAASPISCSATLSSRMLPAESERVEVAQRPPLRGEGKGSVLAPALWLASERLFSTS